MTDQSKPDRHDGDGLQDRVMDALRKAGLMQARSLITTRWKDGIDIDEPSFNAMEFARALLSSPQPTRDAAEGTAPDRQDEWAFCLPWSYDPGNGGSADEPKMPPHVGDADGLVLFDFVRREVRDDTEGELWWVNWHVDFRRLVEAINTIGPNPAFDYAAAPPKPAPDAMREEIERAAKNIRYVKTTMQNDDFSVPQSEKRARLIFRQETLSDVAELLDRLSAPMPSPDGASKKYKCSRCGEVSDIPHDGACGVW